MRWDSEYKLRFWEKFRLRAQQAFAKKDYAVAEKFSRLAVDEAAGLASQNFRQGISYFDCGDALKAQGKLAEALVAYEQASLALEKAQSACQDTTLKTLLLEDTARVLTNSADCLRQAGDFIAAKQRFVQSIDCYNQAIGYSSGGIQDKIAGQQMLKSMLGLADVCQQLGETADADRIYRQVLRLLMESCASQSFSKHARELYAQYLRRAGRESEVAPLFYDLLWYQLINAATDHLHAKAYSLAKTEYGKALKVAYRAHDSKLVMQSYRYLTDVLIAEGDLSDFSKIAAVALDYAKKHGQFFSYDTDVILSQLAEISVIFHYSNAEPVVQELCDLRASWNGRQSEPYGDALVLKALYLQNQKRFSESAVNAAEAFQIYAADMNKKRRFAENFSQLAELLEEQGDLSKAKYMYLQLWQTEDHRLDSEDYRPALRLFQLARVTHRLNNKAESRRYFKQAMQRSNQLPETEAIKLVLPLQASMAYWQKSAEKEILKAICIRLKSLYMTEPEAYAANIKIIDQELRRL